jgi:hypothetical protein
MNKKSKEIFKRYVVAELFGTLGALFVSKLVFILNNKVLTAYGGVFGESVFYYGSLFFMDFKNKSKNIFLNKLNILKLIFSNFRNLFFEFGFSEILDSLIIRPFFLYLMPIVLNNFYFGIILGKIISDVIFYSITIFFYKLRTIIFKD